MAMCPSGFYEIQCEIALLQLPARAPRASKSTSTSWPEAKVYFEALGLHGQHREPGNEGQAQFGEGMNAASVVYIVTEKITGSTSP
jgi:hypothetical protein